MYSPFDDGAHHRRHAACARCTHRRCGSGSYWTTSARTLSTTTDPGRRVGRGEQRRAGSCAAAWTVCWWCRTVPAGRSWTGCGGRRRERRVRGWCGRWTGLRAHIHTRRPPRRASPTLIRNTGKPGIPVCWRMWLSGRSSIPRNVIETGISPGSRYVLAPPLVHPDPHRAR